MTSNQCSRARSVISSSGSALAERGVALIAGDEPKRQYGERWPGQPVQALHEVCHGGVACSRRLGSGRGSRAADSSGLRDEPIALAVNRLDELLRLAVVAERLPRRFHAARHGRVRDDAAVPDLLDDLVLRDQTLAVLDQEREQREHLPLEVDDLAVRPQLDGGEIQLEPTEPVDHAAR